MGAVDCMDPVEPAGRRWSTRPGGRSIVVALLVLLIVGGFCGAVAPTAAAASPDGAQTALARLALSQAQLYAWDGGSWDTFGWSAAMSGDTALVGAPLHDTAGKTGAGAACVFTRSGGVWSQQAELTAPDGATGDWFGWPVALSGATALIGAPNRDTGKMTNAGGVPALFTVVSDTAITAYVPSGAGDGPITVTTLGGTGASVSSFSVLRKPAITGLQPASGKRGALVTINGTSFGAARGASSVRFGGKSCAMYRSWSDTRIVCRVPANAASGTVKIAVKTAGGTSNAQSFRVKR